MSLSSLAISRLKEQLRANSISIKRILCAVSGLHPHVTLSPSMHASFAGHRLRLYYIGTPQQDAFSEQQYVHFFDHSLKLHRKCSLQCPPVFAARKKLDDDREINISRRPAPEKAYSRLHAGLVHSMLEIKDKPELGQTLPTSWPIGKGSQNEYTQ